MTIGYMSEEMKGNQIGKDISDKFLKAILGRMVHDEADNNIRKISILALENAVCLAS